MSFSHITETREWKELQAKLEERKENALLKEQAEKVKFAKEEKTVTEIKEPFAYHDLNDMDYGYRRVSKEEYHKMSNQLTKWGVWNSGLVIKNEGATNVKQAVALTLACIDRVKNPGAYFMKVLKNK